MADKVKCAICTAYIGGRKIDSTSVKVDCSSCEDNFSIHLTCLKKLLTIHKEETRYAHVATDTSQLSYFQCNTCRENCPLCGDSHSLLDSNVELLTCSNSNLHQCYIIGPSKNNNTGCLSKLSSQKKVCLSNNRIYVPSA